jgi:dTDP-D-glucose 4,6-dehydratase
MRDWLYVVNQGEAMRLVMEKARPQEIYDISSGNESPNFGNRQNGHCSCEQERGNDRTPRR